MGSSVTEIAVVTSCNRAGFDKYGRVAIESLHRFWPYDIDLHLVSEDLLPLPPEVGDHRRVVYYNLHQQSTRANDFHVKYKDDLRANGKGTFNVKRQDQAAGYSFRHDAYKFSKKVFAIELVARSIIGGRLIWLDADTVTFTGVPRDLLARLPPDEYPMACLDRKPYHAECGFIGYNLDHPLARQFITVFAALYSSGEVFNLQEWHDSWVFDWARQFYNIPAYHIPHQNNAHPFVYSELGKYMDHLKGSRKNYGVSHDHPLCVRLGKEKVGRLPVDGQPRPTPMPRSKRGDLVWTGSGWRETRQSRAKPRRL
jgi:hypothetical protein